MFRPLSLLVLLGISSSLMAASAPTEEMKKILDAMKSQGGESLETLTAQKARLQPTPADAIKSLSKQEQTASTTSNIEVSDIQIDGAQGKLSARLYKPKNANSLPVVVYFHGGGWVIANNDVYDSTPRALSEKTGAIFLAVEYRKAPEHKFPAAHNDAFAAYQWTLKNAANFGGDPKRVAVAGESAGGNLALNVSIRARDTEVQLPIHQLIIYPVASTDTKSESYLQNKDARPLNAAMMEWFMQNYLRNKEDLKDKRINLVNADLNKLPPTTLITAEIDPLRSEGILLAERLKSFGVDVEHKDFKGVTHEFFGMATMLTEAREAQEFVAKDFKSTLESTKI